LLVRSSKLVDTNWPFREALSIPAARIAAALVGAAPKSYGVDRTEEVAVSVYGFDPFGDPWQMDRLAKQFMSGRRTPMAMPMDVWQTDGGFHVCLDLPGVDPDSVEITTERNVLTIKAERLPEYQEGQNVMIAERPQGSFTRPLQMSDSLDTENIEASYGDGVLHLEIPMAQKAQPRRVQVKTDSGGRRPVTVEGETDESAPASGVSTAGSRASGA